jgi:hypothetical protein
MSKTPNTLNIEVSNEFASIERRYSELADIRIADFIKDPTEELPYRKKDLLIERLNPEQVRFLADVLNGYLKAVGA